ncbi:MAG: alpha/beta hydrolase, partial [Pseudomonadota bacterium]
MSAIFANPILEKADLDPAFAGFLAQAASQGNPPLESLPPSVIRQFYREQADALGLPAPGIGKVFDMNIAGPAGPLRLRVYTPDTQGLQAPLPVLLYIHGGGFVM